MQVNAFVCSNFFPVVEELRFRAEIPLVKLCDASPSRALFHTWEASGDTDVEIELCVERTKSLWEDS